MNKPPNDLDDHDGDENENRQPSSSLFSLKNQSESSIMMMITTILWPSSSSSSSNYQLSNESTNMDHYKYGSYLVDQDHYYNYDDLNITIRNSTDILSKYCDDNYYDQRPTFINEYFLQKSPPQQRQSSIDDIRSSSSYCIEKLSIYGQQQRSYLSNLMVTFSSTNQQRSSTTITNKPIIMYDNHHHHQHHQAFRPILSIMFSLIMFLAIYCDYCSCGPSSSLFIHSNLNSNQQQQQRQPSSSYHHNMMIVNNGQCK